MQTTATYTPPVPTEGAVTITMPETTARKLRALLRCCNGGVFDDIEQALADLDLPAMTLLVEGPNGSTSTYQSRRNTHLAINLHDGLVFKSGDHVL